MSPIYVCSCIVLLCLTVGDGARLPEVFDPPNQTLLFNQLTIGAFNIEVFGVTKMSKPHVVEKLVQILTRYDLVLIQEIRDASDTAIHQLLSKVNEANSGDPFQMVLSARLGRTSSKEQYAYFYRSSKFSVTSIYQWPDDEDIFERPPFTVRFRARNYDVNDFAFSGIHVKPTDAVSEIDAFADVYDGVSALWGLADFILGGDLNAGCNYVRPGDWSSIRLRTQSRFQWLIGDSADTTIAQSACPYDRMIIIGSRLSSAYVSGSAVPFRFDNEYGMTQEQAKEVSDHVPVDMKVR